MATTPPNRASARLERWRIDAGEADVATLDIPGALGRTRRFEVDVRFVVRAPLDVRDAWLELTVELDGRRQWQRRIATALPGETESLDYRCGVQLPPGPGLRVRALTAVHGAQRRQLVIEAEEQADEPPGHAEAGA
jgi:hypothetical protein